jgi:hypothetical protein
MVVGDVPDPHGGHVVVGVERSAGARGREDVGEILGLDADALADGQRVFDGDVLRLDRQRDEQLIDRGARQQILEIAQRAEQFGPDFRRHFRVVVLVHEAGHVPVLKLAGLDRTPELEGALAAADDHGHADVSRLALGVAGGGRERVAAGELDDDGNQPEQQHDADVECACRLA